MNAVLAQLAGIAVILVPLAFVGGLVSIGLDRYIARYEQRIRRLSLTDRDVAANSAPLSSAIENGVTR